MASYTTPSYRAPWKDASVSTVDDVYGDLDSMNWPSFLSQKWSGDHRRHHRWMRTFWHDVRRRNKRVQRWINIWAPQCANPRRGTIGEMMASWVGLYGNNPAYNNGANIYNWNGKSIDNVFTSAASNASTMLYYPQNWQAPSPAQLASWRSQLGNANNVTLLPFGAEAEEPILANPGEPVEEPVTTPVQPDQPGQPGLLPISPAPGQPGVSPIVPVQPGQPGQPGILPIRPGKGKTNVWWIILLIVIVLIVLALIASRRN